LSSIPNATHIPIEGRRSSWTKYDVFKHASGDIILNLDCHVLLAPRFFGRLFKHFEDPANRLDMLTGPVVFNSLKSFATGLNPVWNKHDFGCWMRHEVKDARSPIEIEMQGMGCFAARKDAWVDIPDGFSGFGAEEWFMAEHVRRWGGRVMCHPKMRWIHRFRWPRREYPLRLDDKIFNYYLGWLNLYKTLDHPRIEAMTRHWKTQVSEERLNKAIREAKVLANT